MTAPLNDDLFDGLPVGPERSPRRVLRDVTGLLCVLLGLALVIAVLGSYDPRLALLAGAAVLIGGGLALGRSDEGS